MLPSSSVLPAAPAEARELTRSPRGSPRQPVQPSQSCPFHCILSASNFVHGIVVFHSSCANSHLLVSLFPCLGWSCQGIAHPQFQRPPALQGHSAHWSCSLHTCPLPLSVHLCALRQQGGKGMFAHLPPEIPTCFLEHSESTNTCLIDESPVLSVLINKTGLNR